MLKSSRDVSWFSHFQIERCREFCSEIDLRDSIEKSLKASTSIYLRIKISIVVRRVRATSITVMPAIFIESAENRCGSVTKHDGFRVEIGWLGKQPHAVGLVAARRRVHDY